MIVPGLHGRWEWSKPALQLMAARCRTISYSLADPPSPDQRSAGGFDGYLRQLDDVLDEAGVQRAAICGVSFGGFVALRYAAMRPGRVSALVLASAPGPGFRPSAQQSRWLARPWLSAPAFVLTSPVRIWPEVTSAIPGARRRLAFAARQAGRCAVAPMVPSRMASRMRCASAIDFVADCRRVRSATLVVTGEEGLDRVVPVASTRAYIDLIPQSEHRVIEGTGHIGILTQPDRFADIVSGFVHAHHH